VYAIIEKTMEWYQANSKGRERVGATILRHTIDKFIKEAVKPLKLETIDTPAQRKKFWATGNLYQ
jgi:dissimilatory sulfite reductase (desulfoviridin) alpha/beta subunit